MNLPMDRDLQGRPTGQAGLMTIGWQERMEFDGRVVRFVDSVTASSNQQSLTTETLEVHFRQPIRFARVPGPRCGRSLNSSSAAAA